jgi:hypothetical protein
VTSPTALSKTGRRNLLAIRSVTRGVIYW